MKIDNELLPIDIRLIYNSDYANENFFPDYKVGKGWKLNIMQTLDQRELVLEDAILLNWIYTDGMGLTHVLNKRYYKLTQLNNKSIKEYIYDVDTLIKNATGDGIPGVESEYSYGGLILNEAARTLSDENENIVMHFNKESGRLEKVVYKSIDKTIEYFYGTSSISVVSSINYSAQLYGVSISFSGGYIDQVRIENGLTLQR